MRAEQATYEQWKKEVETLKRAYPEAMMKEAVLRSLSGAALDTITGTRDDSTLEDWLQHLENYYGTVDDVDVLLRGFYAMKHKEDEAVNQFASRLESARRKLNRYMGCEYMGQDSLRERLFHGLNVKIRHRIQHRYDDPNYNYMDLLKQARRVETEIGPLKEEKKTPAKKEGSSRTTLAELTVEDLTAAIKQVVEGTVEAKLQGAGWALPRKMAYSTPPEEDASPSGRGRGGFRGRGRGATGGGPPRDPPDFSKKPKVQAVDLRCYRCYGYGHLAFQCGSARSRGSEDPGNGERGAEHPPVAAKADQVVSTEAEEKGSSPDSKQ